MKKKHLFSSWWVDKLGLSTVPFAIYQIFNAKIPTFQFQTLPPPTYPVIVPFHHASTRAIHFKQLLIPFLFLIIPRLKPPMNSSTLNPVWLIFLNHFFNPSLPYAWRNIFFYLFANWRYTILSPLVKSRTWGTQP